MRADEQASYYDSVFAEHMADFIRYKRAQGLSYSSVPWSLRALSRFIASTGHTDRAISQELADQWCRRRPNERHSTQHGRIVHTNQFFSYLATQGVPVAFPQSPGRRGGREPFTPYVFTRRELDQFFAACDRLEAKSSSVMPVLLPVLFRLLYGCGLRVSEALNLTRGDVDLENCCLTVRHAKFDQDRLVALAPSMAGIMRRYDATVPRLFIANRDTLFFTHKDGRSIAADSIYRWFRKALWAAGISHGGRGHGPRVHDLRHSFAVYSLKAMVDQGADPYWALPVLATYLGHASVAATGQYVRLIPDLFPEVTAAVSAIASRAIPGGDPE
ncbi:tyrosine-type recombinase/integrase [Paeniglutamicibacter gangotriensis]|uniref:Tyrosine-type recombinase/integrase n=1 Tax=Paeniglutamicibacter gangotriensis TaxID=254787 RepID=A0A5B0DQ14_9MICC|nr:tyrosine-type recombinase/integrase [Paeniglutamicibacter gangotriensis]KAA0968854.1 tyrosine-type recombinase/integrase [Paeniglutamicibacter gangotriensis]